MLERQQRRQGGQQFSHAFYQKDTFVYGSVV
jgi:hypothetical protein